MRHSQRLQELYKHESREVRFLTNVYQNSNLIIRGIYSLVFEYGLNPCASQFDLSSVTMDNGVRYSVQELKEWDTLAEKVNADLRMDAESESIESDIAK